MMNRGTHKLTRLETANFLLPLLSVYSAIVSVGSSPFSLPNRSKPAGEPLSPPSYRATNSDGWRGPWRGSYKGHQLHGRYGGRRGAPRCFSPGSSTVPGIAW